MNVDFFKCVFVKGSDLFYCIMSACPCPFALCLIVYFSCNYFESSLMKFPLKNSNFSSSVQKFKNILTVIFKILFDRYWGTSIWIVVLFRKNSTQIESIQIEVGNPYKTSCFVPEFKKCTKTMKNFMKFLYFFDVLQSIFA
jgi:hypothetical protein